MPKTQYVVYIIKNFYHKTLYIVFLVCYNDGAKNKRCAVRSFSCEKLGGCGDEPLSMSTMDITLKGILPLAALAEPAVG